MNVPPIPERLRKAIVFLRGDDDGRAWLDALPARIADHAHRWNLTLESVADSGAMSCCVYCTTRDRTPAVLKIPVDEESGRTEVRLLRRWAAAGAAPSILRHADDSGIFLMTRIIPGDIVWPTGGATDSARFAELLSRINAPGLPEPAALKDLADVVVDRIRWARSRFADPQYADATTRIGATAQLHRAESVLTTLLRTTTVHHVLHADLQAKNILHGPDRWYTINPLGAVGDINAEAALWIAIQDGPASITRRLEEIADHPLLDATRLRAWAYVFAVVEYRPSLPASARRMASYIDSVDLAAIAEIA